MLQGHHYAAPRVTQRKEPRREEQKPEILGSCAPGTLRVYFWTLKLKSEIIHIGDFRPTVKRNAREDKKRMFVYEVLVKRNLLIGEDCEMRLYYGETLW